MKPGPGHTIVDKKMLVLVAALLILNTALVGFILNTLYTTCTDDGEQAALAQKQVMMEDMIDYTRRLAKDLDVEERTSVKEKLATFRYELDLAEDSADFARLLFTHGRQVQETILKEWDALLREEIIKLIDRDKSLQKQPGKIQFTLQVSPGDGASADPPVLHEDSLEEIWDLYLEGGMSQEQVFRIEAEEGRSRMLVPYDPLDYAQALSEELDNLRVSMHELRVAAGLAEMSGPGVLIKLFDGQNGYVDGDLIHDTDVRDLVNELFAAGAKGVAVGGQRLIATSPIRCVGPVIRVNQKEIPANPVVIEAIGDSEVLASALDIIRFSLEFHRNFSVEIEEKEEIVLPQYRN